MKPILIMAATPQETVLLEHALDSASRRRTAAFDYSEGFLAHQPVVICAGGIGKINAAAATAVLIERFQPRMVINTGCAGAYLASGMVVGELAVASEEFLGDEGVITSEGWQDLHFMGIPTLIQRNRLHHNAIPLSKHPAEKAIQLADHVGVKLVRGRFITVSTCSGTRQRGEEIARKFHGICENMEGAAVAQTSLRYGIDCLEIRGVSNLVDERDMKSWDIPRAVEAAQRFVLKYIEEMDRSVLQMELNQTVPMI
jgi:futalosine hydrolase